MLMNKEFSTDNTEGVWKSKTGGDFIVLGHKGHREVQIRFLDYPFETVVRSGSIRKGSIKNPMKPSAFGIGFLGDTVEGSLSSCGKVNKVYSVWRGIISRCYDEKCKYYIRYGGRGVTVHKDWHNFSKFAAWYRYQPNSGRDGYQVDKDILDRDSKEYSSSTCRVVPHRVNCLTPRRNGRAYTYPLGVSRNQSRYRATAHNKEGDAVYICTCQTPEEAFQHYKVFRERVIKEVALSCYEKGEICVDIYKALMSWEISIED